MLRMSARTRATLDRTCASRKFGTAIAARIAMIATTINNSIKVKPRSIHVNARLLMTMLLLSLWPRPGVLLIPIGI
jgi:hypothetical protein